MNFCTPWACAEQGNRARRCNSRAHFGFMYNMLVCNHVCGGHTTSCGRWCSPSLMWFPGSKLGLVVGTLARWGLLPALQSSLSLSALYQLLECDSKTDFKMEKKIRKNTSQLHPARASLADLALLGRSLQFHNCTYDTSGQQQWSTTPTQLPNRQGRRCGHRIQLTGGKKPSSLQFPLDKWCPLRYPAHSTVGQ